MTNEELCTRAKAGDREASNRLIAQNMPFVHRTAAEILNREHQLNRCLGLDAEDLAQEGALGLYRSIERYDPERGAKFLTYAARAIRNAMYDYIAKQELLLLDEDEAASVGDAETEDTETAARLQEAMRRLTDRERVYLTYRLGLDQGFRKRTRADTAYHFHLTPSWARTTEKHALRHLRKLLS